jgi:DNA-binding ferritin-like protein
MDYPATFVSTLLHSATNAHFMHFQTESYAEHKALQKYYEGITDLVDQFAEAYQGAYDKIKAYPDDFHLAKNPQRYLKSLCDFVKEIRTELPKDTQLQNIIDEIAQLIDSTLYKLRFLK